MSKPEFAKAPWGVMFHKKHECMVTVDIVSDGIWNRIATVYGATSPFLSETNGARNMMDNAALIAAAPDMYNLLDKLSDCDELQMYKSEIKSLLAKARDTATIRKGCGE